MILYNLENKNYKKMIENNKVIIVGVYEKNCVISELFSGVLAKINDFT